VPPADSEDAGFCISGLGMGICCGFGFGDVDGGVDGEAVEEVGGEGGCVAGGIVLQFRIRI
jgi:hypothetical protein